MDPGSRKPRQCNPELRAGQRWSRQASGRNWSLNEPSVERVRSEANRALSELRAERGGGRPKRTSGFGLAGWSWPDGVGRLRLAELRTSRWQETKRLSGTETRARSGHQHGSGPVCRRQAHCAETDSWADSRASTPESCAARKLCSSKVVQLAFCQIFNPGVPFDPDASVRTRQSGRGS